MPHRKSHRAKVSRSHGSKRIRYAVVGLGHIAQVAVLPAFAHARNNSEVTALVTDDPVKAKRLSKKYRIANVYPYKDYRRYLESGEIDAVYIALPNSMHREYSVQASEAGIHLLCEKPMAGTEDDCKEMIQAAERNRTKLMVAYRLHFEKATLHAVELIHSGKLGDPRILNSTFTMQVTRGTR